MRFLVEWRLWLLLGVGAMAGVWVAVALQRRTHVLRLTTVEMLDVVAPRQPGWRRHVPAVLFLLALTALIVGFARPVRATRIGEERATVILAIDTSLSMEADDVDPNRLAVAEEAARAFVDDLPPDLNVGLVTFNGSTTVAVAPSADRDALDAALSDLELGEGTAIGDAVFTSLEAVASAPAGEDGEPAPGRIVVMSDGETTVGRLNGDAAAAAAEAGVPVDTIAFGTPEGVIEDDLGVETPVPVAPEPLAEIAATTGGRAFEAGSLDELSTVYDDIGRVVGFETADRDISGWFVGAGILLMAVAGALSLAWSQRLP
ncbi:MAG TPA: VWA domain-containing protein [Acidimicrobiales bacterium]|nr:VWA domain-containing protein [Acidimicrobiales bacterium]